MSLTIQSGKIKLARAKMSARMKNIVEIKFSLSMVNTVRLIRDFKAPNLTRRLRLQKFEQLFPVHNGHFSFPVVIHTVINFWKH